MQAAYVSSVGVTENRDATKAVYLVSFPHPRRAMSSDGVALRTPASFTREAIRDAILDACAHPVYDASYMRRSPGFIAQAIPVEKLVVFLEKLDGFLVKYELLPSGEIKIDIAERPEPKQKPEPEKPKKEHSPSPFARLQWFRSHSCNGPNA